MKIARVAPPPPPAEISLQFTVNEGWAIVAALRDYAERHPGAVERDEWKQWANALDRELRR